VRETLRAAQPERQQGFWREEKGGRIWALFLKHCGGGGSEGVFLVLGMSLSFSSFHPVKLFLKKP